MEPNRSSPTPTGASPLVPQAFLPEDMLAECAETEEDLSDLALKVWRALLAEGAVPDPEQGEGTSS
jgi:hypothetical protein